MADFDVNTITVQGAVAIASATAGDKLVIDGCDATTDVLTQAQAVQIATRPASPASTTDTIGLAGSTDNHVYAYASFIRGESTGGDVHSFLLYGHMESDASTVFVVAVASAASPTHIPTSSDVTNRVEIQFELTFSATDEVVTVADTSMYTTRGEFLLLKNRTVTTHAEGEATTGEDQTIFGSKTFVDEIRVDYVALPADSQLSGVKVAANIYPEDDQEYGLGMAGYAWNGVRAWEVHTTELKNDLDSGTQPILVYSTLSPSGQNSPTLGNASHRWAAVYSEDVVCEGVVCERVSVSSSGTNYLLIDDTGIFPHDSDMNLGGNNSTWDTIYVNDIALGGSNGREIYFEDNSEDIYVSGDIVPGDTSNYELGSHDHTWLTVYTEAISLSNTRTISIDGNSDKIQIDGDFLPETNEGASLGATGRRWQYLHCFEAVTETVTSPSRTCTLKASQSMIGDVRFICDIDSAPVQARIHTDDADSGEVADFYFDYAKFYAISSFDNVDLGTHDHKFGNVYANNLNGMLPTVDGNTEPEVGAIFFAGIEVAGALNAGIGRTAKVGSPLIPGGNNVTAIGPASWDTQTTDFSSYTPFATTAGTYKLLCGATKTGSEAACFALVMRVA